MRSSKITHLPAACIVIIISALTVPVSSQTPAQTLVDVQTAGRDIWGEAATRQPGGASYEFFTPLLPPLRYVDAAFRHYPIVLSAPGSQYKARLVSNGSAINAQGKHRAWLDAGVPVTIEIGAERAVFGEDLKTLDGPRYAQGYLPIVELSYGHGGARYEEEVFASVDPAFADHAAVFARFTLRNGNRGQITAHFGPETPLTVADGTVRDDHGQALAWFDSNWRWEPSRRSLVAQLSHDQSAALAIFTRPLSSPSLPPLIRNTYETQRKMCVHTWEALLRRGIRMEVPERIVNNAWRSLIVGTQLLAKGDVLCYSAGNAYERQFEAECGDAVRALLLYGFTDDARRMIVPLLDYKQEGLAFHDAAFKLQLLAHYYWLTRDAAFLQAQRPRWQRSVDAIVKSRESTSGLLPPEHYCGDIATMVYTLNSNANAWRGLRDMAAVLEEMNDREEARRLANIAKEFREKILDAAHRSERRDVRPPFIPIALFGKENPYETITASKMGSYWNLMIPYVLGSGVFGDDSDDVQSVLGYLHQHGGVCMGMTRFDQHSGTFANDKGLDDLYGLRYVITLLRRDDVERALVSFYGKLAQGFTRDTFIGAEGTGLIPLDNDGRSMYLPPNSSSNALFLWTLRYLLVQDWDTDDDGKPDTLRLLYATPRSWLHDRATLRVEKMQTAFGPVSLRVQSRLARREVLVECTAPPIAPKHTLLRARLPEGWRVVSANVGRVKTPLIDDATVDISKCRGRFTVRFVCEYNRVESKR